MKQSRGLKLLSVITRRKADNRAGGEPPKQETEALAPVVNLTEYTKALDLPNWHISASFGKSTSQNYLKAVTLAKAAPQYHEQVDDGHILHQAFYSAEPDEFLQFVMLYELVSNWKSSFAIINGKLVDRKIVSQLKYCYGDRCRSGKPDFCFGASEATENPFGCHRIQVSAWNHPWWSYYRKDGFRYVLDKDAIRERIAKTARVYSCCPCFSAEKAYSVLDSLPSIITEKQFKKLLNP